MKRIFFTFLLVLVLVLLLGTASFATDGSEGATVLSRIYEFYGAYKAEILEFATGAIGFVISTIILKMLGKNKNSTLAIAEGQTGVVGGINAVIESNNKMVDAYNSMQTTYERYGLTEDERNIYMGAVIAQNTAILEILYTICSNNKNLAQGIKDIVSLKYANCLGVLSDDNKVKALITGVKDKLAVATDEDNTGGAQ